MNPHLILTVFLFNFVEGILNGGRISLTTKMLVRRHGYPFKNYTVQTDDGYLLELHRIPYSPRFNSTKQRPIAFFMHGILSSSSDWVILGPGKSLPYLLSDAGYDVWMGNARGNTYSRKHITHNTESSNFWKFSWHEIAMYDLPAMFNFIRNISGIDKIRYFGHSQGTTSMIALASLKPEVNTYIKSAHLFAPVVFMHHISNRFIKLLAPVFAVSNLIKRLLESTELRPVEKFQRLLGTTLCPNMNRPNRILCNNVLFLVSGFNDETIESSIIPDVLSSTPAGSSTNQILHYLQEFNSGSFRQFDHGLYRNMEYYGSPVPPNYPLKNIKMPIFMYYGLADSLVAKKDVLRLVKSLKAMVRAYEIPYNNFDHLSFLYTPNIVNKLYKKVIEDVATIK